MTIMFKDDITFETVKGLIEKLETMESPKIVYFSSSGGNAAATEVLLNYIDQNREDIEMIFFWENSSAAFELAMEVKCIKSALPTAFGYIHPFTRNIATRELLDPNTYDSLDMVDKPRQRKEEIEKYKGYGLNEDELKRFTNGDDICLFHDRWRILFNRSNKKR